MGKAGAKRKRAFKKLFNEPVTVSIESFAMHYVFEFKHNISQTKKKVECGYAKKAKRRSLRGVVVPADLKDGKKRGHKKLLIAAMLVDHAIAKDTRVDRSAMVVK